MSRSEPPRPDRPRQPPGFMYMNMYMLMYMHMYMHMHMYMYMYMYMTISTENKSCHEALRISMGK